MLLAPARLLASICVEWPKGAAWGVVGTAEVRAVEDVEELGSEAKPQMLGEVKLPLHRKIRLPGSETAQRVPSEIALLPSRQLALRQPYATMVDKRGREDAA